MVAEWARAGHSARLVNERHEQFAALTRADRTAIFKFYPQSLEALSGTVFSGPGIGTNVKLRVPLPGYRDEQSG